MAHFVTAAMDCRFPTPGHLLLGTEKRKAAVGAPTDVTCWPKGECTLITDTLAAMARRDPTAGLVALGQGSWGGRQNSSFTGAIDMDRLPLILWNDDGY